MSSPDEPGPGAPRGREITRGPDVALLASRYGLDQAGIALLNRFLRLLVEDPLAPTAVRDPRGVLNDHLADALVALEVRQIRQARMLADIGSGAGLPGLPLAIARSDAGFSLVESAARKCSFIARAVRECRLANVEVVQARAEEWSEGVGRFDVVMARAVSGLDVVLEYAAPLLVPGGTVVVWRGRRDQSAEAAATRAAEVLGLRPEEILPVRPHRAAHHRHLHLFSKVRQTPSRFPRRAGTAVKRPLGAAKRA